MRTQKITIIIIALLTLLCAPGRGDAAGAFARSGGTFSRTLTFSAGDYAVTSEEGFDFVTIPGTHVTHDHLKPVLPYFVVSLNLPRDASVTSLELTGGSTRSLGRLNIPNYQLSPMNDPLPIYTDVTDLTGLAPQTNYYHFIMTEQYYSEAVVHFFPVQHNVDTEETTLWTEATLEIRYETDECVFVPSFWADRGRDYRTTEEIRAVMRVENAGDEDVTGLTAVITLTDGFDQTLRTAQQAVDSVPAGEGRELTISIDNGLRTGSYWLLLEIRDEEDAVVTFAADSIGVVSVQVSDFTVSGKSFDADAPVSFTITFENHNPYEIRACPEVRICDKRFLTVATLAAPAEYIPAQSSRDITLCWPAPGKAPGQYSATGSVTVGEKTYSSYSEWFTISLQGDLNGDLVVDMADFILAIKILVSENTDSATPGSTDTDGKIDLDDVLRILREIAEDMPVSP